MLYLKTSSVETMNVMVGAVNQLFSVTTKVNAQANLMNRSSMIAK